MENFIDKKLDLTSAALELENGKVYFIGEALTKDYECEEGLTVLSGKLKNKHFTWRHRHPIEKIHKENHVYGIVEDSWVDEKLMAKVRMYDHTKDHLKLIQDIQLRDLVNDPLSLSMHYRTYFNEKGEVKHYDVFELAGTPFPHCKKCNILSGVRKMEDEKTEPVENKEEEAELEQKDENQEAIDKIKAIEEELNAKTKAYEELESKVQKLEEDLESKDKELEDSKKSVDVRVLELEAKIDFLETKKPILDKLLEADSDIDKNQADWLKTQEVSYLEQRLEDAIKRAESQIVTTELEETAEEAKAEKDKEEDEVEKVTFEQFTSQIGFKKERK